MMVLEPLVVIVGDPVVVPEYLAVGTDRITTPDPPFPEARPVPLPVTPPEPPPVLAVPADPAVSCVPDVVAPPPKPPGTVVVKA